MVAFAAIRPLKPGFQRQVYAVLTKSSVPMSHPRLAVSTWSLHNKLGLFYDGPPNGTARTPSPRWGEGEIRLLDVPAQAAAHGIHAIEICHFHFPSTEASYLFDLQAAAKDAGVRILTVLIDEGDVTSPDIAKRERDLATMASWIEVAGRCGAERARVIAGDAAPDAEGDALSLSASAMRQLADRAADSGVRLATENWHMLLSQPREVIALLDMLDGRLGLCFDFGNWPGGDKYERLAQIAPYAETTHAKAQYESDGRMEQHDFTHCLDILARTNFKGPHSLIFDTPGEEWAGIEEVKAAVLPYL